MKLKQVMAITLAHQSDVEALGGKTLDLFGSVARDEASPDSDIDFLVEFRTEPTLFDLFQVQHYLENFEVDDFCEKLQKFKLAFPERASHQVYGALAAIELVQDVDR